MGSTSRTSGVDVANIKRVVASGVLPFDCYNDPELAPWLAFFAGPTSGIRLSWDGPIEYRPNEHGGDTAMYAFLLAGEEAVRWPALDDLLGVLQRLGTVAEWRVDDIEA